MGPIRLVTNLEGAILHNCIRFHNKSPDYFAIFVSAMLNGVKNIILDLGGVIINLDQELTHTAFQKLFQDNYETLHQESLKINLFEEYEVGNISTNDFIAHFQQFNPVVTPNQIVEAWNGMLLDIPVSRIELINKLKERYNVYLLSNTNVIKMNLIRITE